MGKDAVPDGANWTCPSFSSYWRQRFVSVVQTSTAAMVLSRARRVAELRVLGVNTVVSLKKFKEKYL
jgi:hypothetical protein